MWFDGVVGAEWIRPANDSKSYRNTPLLTFDLTAGAEVNVAMDKRAGKPNWIDATWEDRGVTLTSSNGVTYELFRKTFPAGQVSLGPQSGVAGSTSQYIVIAQSSTQAAIADTAVDAWYDLSHAGPNGGPLNH
jgi:hypothetical protein